MGWALKWDVEGRDWPHRAHSRFVQAAGLRWHVQVAGEGPTFLLLHGTGAASHSFSPLLPLLAKHARVIVPDLPGHGFTGAGSGRHTLPGMARALSELCKTLGSVPDVIIGHSAGAAIALRMVLDGASPAQVIAVNGALTPFRGLAALLFPAMARALALNPLTPLVASRGLSDPTTIARILSSSGGESYSKMAGFYQTLVASPAHVDGALKMMARWDLAPLERALGRISVPVTLLYGSADKAVPMGETQWAASAIPQSEDIVFEGLGHLMHETNPEEIAKVILERVPAGAVNI